MLHTFKFIKDPWRTYIVQKISLNQPKAYLSLKGEGQKILGSSVSSFNYGRYQNVDFKIVYSKEKRKNKYAPKIKCRDKLDLSLSKIKVMDTMVALAY